MLELIGFILLCIIWQEIKDAFRGEKKPTVRMKTKVVGSDQRDDELREFLKHGELTVGDYHAKAECGCEIVGNKVVKPCTAHEILRKASNE